MTAATTSTRLLLYNSKLPHNNFHLFVGLKRGAESLPGVTVEIAHPATLGLHLRTFRPDVVLSFGGEQIGPKTLPLLADYKGTAPEATWALWTTEDPFELEVTTRIAPFFDVVFTTDQGSLAAHKGHRSVHYLPLAGDPELTYRPVIEDPKRLPYDLLFVGTAWPNRVAFLKRLVGTLCAEGLKARFVLPTNPHIPPPDDLGLLPFERDFRLSLRDLATLQNRSRFVLTLFRDFSAHDTRARPQTSPSNRFYETALAGTAQIVVSDAIDMGAVYPELREALPSCHTAEEVVAAVSEGRRDPARRNEMARRQQDFALDKHLYRHRAAEMLRILGRKS